jgi:hypothetical protein
MTEGLSDDQVRALLAIAASYDHRQLTESSVAAWTEAARVGRWDFVTARDAIVWHNANDPEYLKPAHITRYIRAKRQQPQHVTEARQLPAAPPAQPEHVRSVIFELSKRLRWQDKQPDAAARAVQCPPCHAAPGRPCTRVEPRGHRAGEHIPLKRGHHPSRVKLAGGDDA